MKHLKYASYVIRHKWFVMLECFKVGLYWRGLTHDLSKLLPDEWFPYANYFYGNCPSFKDLPAGIKETFFGKTKEDVEKDFDFAWLLHQKRNPHHWQWWILIEDDGGTKILDIPLKFRKEMLADWRGAGKAQGYGDNTKTWYEKNKGKMQLHPETKKWIEKNI